MNKIPRPLLVQAGTVLLLLALWEVLGESRVLFQALVPGVLEILGAAWIQVATGFLWPHFLVTLYEASAGFLAAAFSAIPTGILLGANPFLRKVLEPPILYFAATPKIILYPIFLMVLGVHFESKMAMAAVSAFFPLVINATMGAASVSGIFIKVARSVGASGFQIVTRVYLPSMLLPIVAGMRLGLGAAIVGAILGELKVSNAGLGFIIIQAFNHFRIADMYASILLTFVFAAVVNLLMTLILGKIRRFSPQRGF
ncbi:MAG: ABC transporter permease [Deltaproteobacteria bacterium]|nr:ABC transporter permease [Deltaproteobacteria bacterium]